MWVKPSESWWLSPAGLATEHRFYIFWSGCSMWWGLIWVGVDGYLFHCGSWLCMTSSSTWKQNNIVWRLNATRHLRKDTNSCQEWPIIMLLLLLRATGTWFGLTVYMTIWWMCQWPSTDSFMGKTHLWQQLLNASQEKVLWKEWDSCWLSVGCLFQSVLLLQKSSHCDKTPSHK